QAEDGIRDFHVTGVQTCALPISPRRRPPPRPPRRRPPPRPPSRRSRRNRRSPRRRRNRPRPRHRRRPARRSPPGHRRNRGRRHPVTATKAEAVTASLSRVQDPYEVPSRRDAVVRTLTAFLGGPTGRHAVVGARGLAGV